MTSEHGAVRQSELEPSDSFSPEFRQRVVDSLGSDGAWLALSQMFYGWRANYDLAVAAYSAATPEYKRQEGRPSPVDHEFTIAVGLHIQGLLFAAAEQFLITVLACNEHETQTRQFFDAYVQPAGYIGQLAEKAKALSREQIERIFGLPITADDVRDEVRLVREEPPADSDVNPIASLAASAVETDSGLLIPKAVIERGAERGLADKCEHFVAEVAKAVVDIGGLVEKPQTAAPDGSEPSALREVDNSFRHGHRVLYRSALPERRTFGTIGVGDTDGEYFVDLYIPDKSAKPTGTGLTPKRVNFGSLDRSPERVATDIASIRHVCLMTGRVIRGFVGKQALQRYALLLAAQYLELGGDH